MRHVCPCDVGLKTLISRALRGPVCAPACIHVPEWSSLSRHSSLNAPVLATGAHTLHKRTIQGPFGAGTLGATDNMAQPGQKVVLITGCSSGIGLRIAVLLAKDPQQRYYGKRTNGPWCMYNFELTTELKTVNKETRSGAVYNYLKLYTLLYMICPFKYSTLSNGQIFWYSSLLGLV